MTYLMYELIFCIFQAAPLRHFYFVCAPYKGDLPTHHDSLLPRTCPVNRGEYPLWNLQRHNVYGSMYVCLYMQVLRLAGDGDVMQ